MTLLYLVAISSDASRTGYAEAKGCSVDVDVEDDGDASRTGYAEAKKP